jgi:TonB-linked SusC/RagA family outer membrane protein
MSILRERAAFAKKLLLAGRLTGIILLVACLHVSAGSIAQQHISLYLKAAPLERVFAEIEKQSGYTVFYNTAVLKYAKPVTIEMTDVTVEEVLRVCLGGVPLEFTIQDRTIFVKHVNADADAGDREGGDKHGAAVGTAPSIVSGTVQTEAGQPLAGATVAIRGINKVAVSNAKGEVVLKDVPDGEYDLEISYVGFERLTTKIKVINHGAVFTAALRQLVSKLDETVVKGYYTTTNRLNTGNVTTVKGEDIQKQPVSDPILALEARVPGLFVQQTSGIPGAYATIQIRGQNSIANGNDPLYIVDGVPFTSVPMASPNLPTAVGVQGVVPGQNAGQGMSPFNSLNPADIESVEVLKDADATAIYGSRGANGVVLITTRKGRIGSTKFEANVYTGQGHIEREIKLLNTPQYLAMRHQAFVNDGKSVTSTSYDINGVWDSTRYTDWQKVLIGNTSQFTNAQGSISGGNANTQFIFGGGYSKQTTVYPGDYHDQKASLHFNLTNTSPNGKFRSQLSAQYVNDNSLLPYADFARTALFIAPDAPALYDANGNLNWQSGTWTNPMAATLQWSKAVTNNLIGDLNLSYEVLPGLQLKTNLGYTLMGMDQDVEIPASAYYGPPSPTNRIHEVGTSSIHTWIIEPQVSYGHRIGKGRLDVLVGTTNLQNIQRSLGVLAYGFLTDEQISDVTAASNLSINGNYYTEYHYAALYGRVGYNWEDKYLLNVTARRDGSSRFGPGNQFGNFGAVGAGWIFSREKTVEKVLPFLSFGKLRASYGTTGNDQIASYQYLSSYSFYMLSPYQGITTIYPTYLANPYFGWELVKKLEGGIELGFWKDRVLLNVSYFRNRTGNQLLGQPLSSITGFTTIQANLPGVVENSGAEFLLNSINVRTAAFSWTSSINLTIPRNKLVAFPGLSTNPSYENSLAIGKPVSIFKQLRYTGLNSQTGLYTFEDVNHDGAISALDLQFLKQVARDYYGGIQNTVSYKGLQLDFLVQFVRQTARNYRSNFAAPGIFNVNQPTLVLNAWSAAGQNSAVQKYTQNRGTPAGRAYSELAASDASISDASFWRLKNLSLSYQLPSAWQRAAHLQNARIYLQGQNLFTITSFMGLDPETPGVNLPPLRMLTGGIQISL